MSILSGQSDVSVLQKCISTVIDHPYRAALALLLLTCIITRVTTGFRYRAALSKNQTSPGTAITLPLLPYWAPWIGQAIGFAVGGSAYLEGLAKSLGTKSSVFAILMGGNKTNVVTTPSVARQILFDRRSPITLNDFIYHVMKTFWDDRGTMKAIDPDVLFGDIHGVLYGMLRESFVTKALRGTIEGLQDRTWNLISGCPSPVDQAAWERSGQVGIVSEGDSSGSKPFIAEANLHLLLRDFVGDLATKVLFGHEFMENNPEVLQDLWLMDSKFNMSLAGLPSWWPGMAAPCNARERILKAIEDHHDALARYLDGEDTNSEIYSDLSDVSSVIVDRLREFKKAGSKPRGWATGNGAILWVSQSFSGLQATYTCFSTTLCYCIIA